MSCEKNRRKKKNQKKTVSMIVTSCNRTDLLLQTLASFEKYNTYRLEQKIIVEDCMNKKERKELSEELWTRFDERYIVTPNLNCNGSKNPHERMLCGHDTGASMCYSDYIWQMEEDWEFLNHSFIERAKEVLDENEQVPSGFFLSEKLIR